MIKVIDFALTTLAVVLSLISALEQNQAKHATRLRAGKSAKGGHRCSKDLKAGALSPATKALQLTMGQAAMQRDAATARAIALMVLAVGLYSIMDGTVRAVGWTRTE